MEVLENCERRRLETEAKLLIGELNVILRWKQLVQFQLLLDFVLYVSETVHLLLLVLEQEVWQVAFAHLMRVVFEHLDVEAV